MPNEQPHTGKRLFPPQDAVHVVPGGYYCGDRPNPNLLKLVQAHCREYDFESDQYDVRAFTQPIETKRSTAVFNMHTYWSKKPHDAIRQYVRHYTRPGDVVLDPFCGSGGTALAALFEGRKAIAIDRSPAATFITKNYCTPVDPEQLLAAFQELKRKVQPELDWLYETRCDRCNGPATTGYIVYSQVFQCPRCLAKVPLFDCVEVEGRRQGGKAKRLNACPHCHAKGHEEVIRSQGEKFGAVPVLASYFCQSGCRPPRGERRHNDPDPRKREFFERYDLCKLQEIDARPIPHWFPPLEFPRNFARWKCDLRLLGVRKVADMFTRRNLWAVASILASIRETILPSSDSLLFTLTSILLKCSKMMAHNSDGIGRILKGTYYIPQVMHDVHVGRFFAEAVSDMIAGFKETGKLAAQCLISTSDARRLAIPSNSVDYIFTDPPYAGNVQYGELNFVWEAWLNFDTGWHADEIVINESRGKTEGDWDAMMRAAVAECYRVLKPGRWLSLCYHDTSEGTWALVQDILAEVGFISERTDSALYIGTKTKTPNQYFADKVTKRDLVFNFRKPKPDEWQVSQAFVPANADLPTFHELGRQIIRDFLAAHPGSTKDRIYDALVSCMVSQGQMEAHNFHAILRSVAEEVQQPIVEDVSGTLGPELRKAHVHGRWYLTETTDQADGAERAKEDAAASCLSKFLAGHLERQPELDGMHFSDLFEQYLPVQDKPRRLLADWLPEYFIKTPGGTWRAPDVEQAEQLARLRAAGTLRRIKRFASALLEGVPALDKDRPGSDADLLDWLRQCRRAGRYEQGRAIYERGGLNLANLSDQQQIEAEDDYRICLRRGSEEEAKPTRKNHKKQDDEWRSTEE